MPHVHVRAWLASVGTDVRIAFRQFLRSPAFVTAAVLTLAIGIGATTAIFTVVDGVLLRPLPYPAPEAIVQLWQLDAAGNRTQFSDPNFDDMRDGARSFTGLAEFASSGPVLSVTGSLAPTRASMTPVTHDFFDVLGVRPVLGRTLLPDEEREGGTPAAVLSWGFWQRAFGASPDALGQRLVVGDRTYTVVGVMGPALDFPAGTDFWTSRELTGRLPSRTAHNWQVIGRLRPGVTLDQAQRDVGALARTLAARLGSETLMASATIVPLREQLVGATRPVLLVLLGASAVLMLIACANVANLLVARLAVRRAGLAVRLALGASRTRLIQQSLAESAMLAFSGGALGLVIAFVATKILLTFQPGWLARAGEVRLDGRVLLFACGVSIATAVLLTAVCTWRATRGDPREPLSASQRTTSSGASVHLRDGLVVAQVAMTLVLLVAAGLFARTFTKLLTVDPGFRTERSVVMDFAIQAMDDDARRQRTEFYRELLERLNAVPGLTAGAVNVMPLASIGGSNGNFIEMASPAEPITDADMPRLLRDHDRTGQAAFRVASGGYFAAMHIPLLEGRTFDDRDTPDAPHVAVISASLAKARWLGRDPIGRWIEFGNMDGDLRPLRIVGVVGDVRERGLNAPAQPTVYANYLQRPVATTRMNVVLAGPTDPAAVAASARAIVSDLRPDVSPRIRAIESIVDSSVAGPRFVLLLAGAFGGAAILLAALGVYSVISYLVAQRTRELSIRAALGADRATIVRLVVRHGAALAAGGIAVGAVAAIATTRLLAGLLYGVSPTDPIAFAGVVLVVGAVVLAASWLPARRASRLDVMRGLRGD